MLISKQSLHVVDSKEFREMILFDAAHLQDEDIPHRSKLRMLIQVSYNAHRAEVRIEMQVHYSVYVVRSVWYLTCLSQGRPRSNFLHCGPVD